MIEDPTLNTLYRLIRPHSAFMLERQANLSRKFLTNATFDKLCKNQVNLFAEEFERLLPEEKFAFSDEEADSMNGFYWRYFPVNEQDCYVRGISRWSMMTAGYLNGRLHKFLIIDAISAKYYWGRVNKGVFTRLSRLRVNDNTELDDLAVAIDKPDNMQFPAKLGSKVSFWVSSGSPLLDLVECAAGRLDMFAATITADLLPVVLTMMQETGGLVCDANGELLGHSNVGTDDSDNYKASANYRASADARAQYRSKYGDKNFDRNDSRNDDRDDYRDSPNYYSSREDKASTNYSSDSTITDYSSSDDDRITVDVNADNSLDVNADTSVDANADTIVEDSNDAIESTLLIAGNPKIINSYINMQASERSHLLAAKINPQD